MRWDIDKGIAAIEETSIPGTAISRTLVETSLFKEFGVTPTKDQKERKSGMLWCFMCGKQNERKLFFYGQTIHEAFLRARRALKKLTALERQFYGIKAPTKKHNSYASARRKKDRK